MDKKDKKKKSDKSAAKSCCYHVVDACGCVVGIGAGVSHRADNIPGAG